VDQEPPPPAARRRRAARPAEPPPAPVAARSVPPQSQRRAAAVFKDFSASRFSGGGQPASYVDPGGGPAAVSAAHRRIMARQLEQLAAADAAAGGMTLALPAAEIGRLLPSIDTDAATVDLADVLTVAAQQLRGAEFYARGNPVLNRIELRSRARALMATLNAHGAAAPQAAEADGSAPKRPARTSRRQPGAAR
jgi:hypothetical protein